VICGPRMVTSTSRVAPRPAHSEEGVTWQTRSSIEICPGENGGHRVVHNFKREPSKKEGSMGGGIYSERRKSEEHFFGTSEDSKILPHFGKR
jgi:hypothetical protein